MTTEPKNLHYLIPVDALRTREWLQHGIESLDSDKALKRFTAFIDEVAVAFFCALNTCSYAALTIVEPLADLIKAHPVDAFNSVGRNLVKAIGSFAGIFFGLYMAGGALFASHKFMKRYTPINPKTLKEEKEELEQTKAELEATIAASDRAKEALEQQLEEATRNARTFEQTKAELEARIATSDRAKETLDQQLEEATRNAGTFEQTRADLEARINTSNQAKEALEQQLAQANENAGTFEQTKTDLEARIATSNQTKEALEQQLAQANENAGTFEQTIAVLEARITESDRAKEALEQQLEEATRNAETFEQTKTDLEARIATSDRAKEALEQQLAEATRNAGTFEQTIADLEARIATSDQAKEALEQQLEEATRNAETSEQRLAALAEEKNTLAGDKAELGRELETANDQLAEISKNLELERQSSYINQIKLDINLIKQNLDKIDVANKENICQRIRISHITDMETSVDRRAFCLDDYEPTTDINKNKEQINKLASERSILEEQLASLQLSQEEIVLSENYKIFSQRPYTDPAQAHKFTVHLDFILNEITEERLILCKEGIDETCKLFELFDSLLNTRHETPYERYDRFVKSIRSPQFFSENISEESKKCVREILEIHMSGVTDRAYLICLVDRILDVSSKYKNGDLNETSDAFAYLRWMNAVVDNAPKFFKEGGLACSWRKFLGSQGITDFMGAQGGNLMNVRGEIKFNTGQTVSFLRGPTPTIGSGKGAAKGVFQRLAWVESNGNGEQIAKEEKYFCQLLEEKKEAMLVSVHERLYPRQSVKEDESGRCLARLTLEDLSNGKNAYNTLFQPYDGPLYDEVSDDLEKEIITAFVHNDKINKYGCLLPKVIRDNHLNEYKNELQMIINHVKNVYFDGEMPRKLDFEVPSSLKAHKDYKSDQLMAQRAFLHFFYIAQSEHMMTYLNGKISSELKYFKSQCKDAQDRTGMEALVQEVSYAMRQFDGQELIDRIKMHIKENIGQCMANKWIAFHGKRFVLGSIVFGYLMHRLGQQTDKESAEWREFISCKHLPPGEQITGMNIKNPDVEIEPSHTTATSISSYLDALGFYYHGKVRKLKEAPENQPSDPFTWFTFDRDLERNNLIEQDINLVIDGHLVGGGSRTLAVLNANRKRNTAIQEDSEVYKFISNKTCQKLADVLAEKLQNNKGLKIRMEVSSPPTFFYRTEVNKDRVGRMEASYKIFLNENEIGTCQGFLVKNFSKLDNQMKWTWQLSQIRYPQNGWSAPLWTTYTTVDQAEPDTEVLDLQP